MQRIILINKSILPLFKMMNVRKFIVKLQTHLKQPKFQLNVKVPEKRIGARVIMEKQRSYKIHYMCWTKRKKGRPLPLANISLTENAEKTLREYSELHNKNNNVIYILLRQIELFLYWIQNLCLSRTWLTIALVTKHFGAQGGWNNFTKNQCDEKQKPAKDNKAAWHEFLQSVENKYYHTSRSIFCSRFEKNIQRNKIWKKYFKFH